MQITLLQLNYTIGDVTGNALKIINKVKETKNSTGLFVTSELAICGYPPRDFLLNSTFIQSCLDNVKKIAEELKDYPPVLVGFPLKNENEQGRPLFNAAAFLKDGEIKQIFKKTLLPSYDVFDEDRYFESADQTQTLKLNDHTFGITICEDIWNDSEYHTVTRYTQDPLYNFAEEKIDAVINLSASPFTKGKQQRREEMISSLALKYNTPFIYVNQIGGNDDLIFAGRSCYFDKKGVLKARASSFAEDVLTIDLNSQEENIFKDDFTDTAECFNALVLGTRDYINKCGFKKCIIGLSGGIDSALVAVIAAYALGSENVLCVMMPSPYSSKGSIDDSIKLAKLNNIKTIKVPIEGIMKSFDSSLSTHFAGLEADLTEENIQSRIRGNILMAMSNKYKSLLLTTGNKSEIAVGYCTIYGDMAGALSVIADLPKTFVFEMCRFINQKYGEKIPVEIINKPPSAELRPDQKDEDSLPPYEVLDEILHKHIELHYSKNEIIAAGFDKEIVEKVLHLVKISEFKRKQAAPGIKITDRAFGTGWRMPIAARKNF